MLSIVFVHTISIDKSELKNARPAHSSVVVGEFLARKRFTTTMLTHQIQPL